MSEEHVTLCRFCGAFCPIRVTVEDGRATRVVGVKESPLYAGYTCIKGRALPDQHNDPNRVLHSLVRDGDGVHRPIGVEQAMDAVGTFSGMRSRAAVSAPLKPVQVQSVINQVKVTPVPALSPSARVQISDRASW